MWTFKILLGYGIIGTVFGALLGSLLGLLIRRWLNRRRRLADVSLIRCPVCRWPVQEWFTTSEKLDGMFGEYDYVWCLACAKGMVYPKAGETEKQYHLRMERRGSANIMCPDDAIHPYEGWDGHIVPTPEPVRLRPHAPWWAFWRRSRRSRP
jgi:hypothetical protein